MKTISVSMLEKIAKEAVRIEGEPYSDSKALGHCFKISESIAHLLLARKIKAVVMWLHEGRSVQYNTIESNHGYVFLPGTRQIIDTQLWQLDGAPDNLASRKVVFSWEEYNQRIEIFSAEPLFDEA